MSCGWWDGEWVNIQWGMDMDVAVEDLQGRGKGGDKGMGLEVRKTQKRSLAVVCWGAWWLRGWRWSWLVEIMFVYL